VKYVYVSVIILCLSAAAFLCTLTAQQAGAGISAQGYANIAQRAVNRAGVSFGYHATCRGIYDTPGPNFTIKCRVTEKP
jgi:hypothetical protein